MNTGLVSIMMPAFNAEQYIGQAIQSVTSQSYPSWELVVVDDGSTDGTARVVEQFKDLRIKLIHQANGGEAAARNTALQHMTGEFIAFLDADDLYLPDHLKLTVGILQQHPEWDGVYTDGIHIDAEGNELPSLSSRRRGPFQGNIFEKLVWASDVFGPPLCVVIRREKVVQHDLRFDPRIVIGPDWDFFIQFTEFACFGYLGQITCKYRIHLTNISLSTKQQVRLDSLALCRRKAIQLSSFSNCSIETRAFVFYDLLMNLLKSNPVEQDTIMRWPQFLQMPEDEQARLLRLAAGRGIAYGTELKYPREWLKRSRKLSPRNVRGAVLDLFLTVSPRLTAEFLRRRYAQQDRNTIFSPFSDLIE